MKLALKHPNTEVHDSNLIHHEVPTSYRLNKFISDAGICSRREADRRIEAGRVMIDGVVAVVGQQVFSGNCVSVDGRRIGDAPQNVYIALNKPTGITCTTDLEIPGNIVEFMNYDAAIFPIGRLDKDSSGLILLTNDGDVVNKILREENGHDKEYRVSVDHPFDENFLDAMRAGVNIYNQQTHQMQTTNPSMVTRINERTFTIVLNQGLNRQIRRMTKALGYKVVTLKRLRIMNISCHPLKVGEWRYLTNEELITMNNELKKSQ